MICMRAPVAATSSDESALTLACVPTGMNAGVGTSPWRVRDATGARVAGAAVELVADHDARLGSHMASPNDKKR